MFFSRVLAALLLATAGIGDASAAAMTQLRPGERPAAGSTESELWYGMDQAEKQIRQSPSIVRDPALYAQVEQRLRDCCAALALDVAGWHDSPIDGGDGNREFFIHARRKA